MVREHRMNVLFVNSNREWGGGEVWLTAIAGGLSDRGHNITVVCRPGSALYRRLEGKDHAVIPLRLSGDFNPATMYRLYRLLHDHEIDLVCVHTEKELRIAGTAGAFARVPVVVSQDVDVAVKDSFLNRLYYGKVAEAVMVNSHATRNTLLSAAPWLQTRRIHVVWKGLDLPVYESAERSAIRQKLGIADEDCVAGFTGRLDEQKGIPTLLDAARLAVTANPRLRLLIAGEGNLHEFIRSFIEQHALERNIFMTGFVENIPSFLKAVDFVVVPSYWEGFCYSALEAMAAGKMVIGSNTSSIPELVVHNSTGILVPPRSAEDLAGAMISASLESELRQEMGLQGRSRAQRLFPLHLMYDRTEEFFFAALAKFSHRERRTRTGNSKSTPYESIPLPEMVKNDRLHITP
ncbi:MAG TPA: glycosyltransferase family 4 protein [Bacteroidota bacterium]|nr:glycosyltransferase family 4 protein [Bacteroidota bacterium]